MTPLLLAALLVTTVAAAETPALTNGGFEDGLTGWTVDGPATAVADGALDGKGSARLGPHATLRQRYAFSGSRHLWVQALVRADAAAHAKFDLRHLDGEGRELLILSSDRDIKEKKNDVWGYWLRVHPRAAAVEIVLANEGEGSVLVDQVVLKDSNDGDDRVPLPQCDLNAYMAPFWGSDLVRDETVLMLSQDGAPARGRLLFAPSRVLSVRDEALGTTYEEGKDYVIEGRELVCPPGSRLPQMKDADFERGDLKWFKTDGKHVAVTYQHADRWTGPTPQYRGDQLPNTMRLLRSRASMTVVAYGDSITFGINASRKRWAPPYMPTWAQLVVARLRDDFDHGAIAFYDASLSGGDSAGAARLASRMVGTLDPDLVLVAFGMNDFWGTDAGAFKQRIGQIIADVRKRKASAEFVLVAPMLFDAAYSGDAKHRERINAYAGVLAELCGQGVQLVDMTAISRAIYDAKKAKDCITDPLHPNDFLARWYAQSIYALFHEPAR